jgi:predicted NUDIX family NTP pyrophosphohydrolase
MNRLRTSAGLLMFRKSGDNLEVLLVHPGGPYFRNKDDGAWTIPKGEVADGEEFLTRARTEFEEELGMAAPAMADWIELGSVKQKGGKTVQAWAFEGDCAAGFVAVSNSFEIEWPPRSGRMQKFPEIDRAEFFSIGEAKKKINEAQIAFLDRLVEALEKRGKS